MILLFADFKNLNPMAINAGLHKIMTPQILRTKAKKVEVEYVNKSANTGCPIVKSSSDMSEHCEMISSPCVLEEGQHFANYFLQSTNWEGIVLFIF